MATSMSLAPLSASNVSGSSAAAAASSVSVVASTRDDATRASVDVALGTTG